MKSLLSKTSMTIVLSACSLFIQSASYASDQAEIGGELQTSEGQSRWVECVSYSAENVCTEMKVFEGYQNKRIINSSNDPFKKMNPDTLTQVSSDTYLQLIRSRLHNDTTTSTGDCDGATEGGNAAVYYSCLAIAKLADAVESPYSLSRYLIDRGENSAQEARFVEMYKFMTDAKNRGTQKTVSDFDLVSLNAGLKKSLSE